jgi:hypothetical protein
MPRLAGFPPGFKLTLSCFTASSATVHRVAAVFIPIEPGRDSEISECLR